MRHQLRMGLAACGQRAGIRLHHGDAAERPSEHQRADRHQEPGERRDAEHRQRHVPAGRGIRGTLGDPVRGDASGHGPEPQAQEEWRRGCAEPACRMAAGIAAHQVEERRKDHHVGDAFRGAHGQRGPQPDGCGKHPEKRGVGQRSGHQQPDGPNASARPHKKRNRRHRTQQVDGHEELRLAHRGPVAVHEHLLQDGRRHRVGHRRQEEEKRNQEAGRPAGHGSASLAGASIHLRARTQETQEKPP